MVPPRNPAPGATILSNATANLKAVKWKSVLPTARHRCNVSWKGAVLSAGARTWRWPLQTRHTHRSDTASIMKDLWFDFRQYVVEEFQIVNYETRTLLYFILIIIFVLKLISACVLKLNFRTKITEIKPSVKIID